MPIYYVEADIGVMILADSEEAAERMAERALAEEVRWNGIGNHWPPCRVTALDMYPNWADALPHGSTERTCAQILGAEAEAEKRRPPTAEEIEAAGQQRLIA
jgi:hypothetical protein